MHTSGNGHYRVGESLQVEALLELPSLSPTDLSVELYAGPISGGGETIDSPQVIRMEHTREVAPGRHLYLGRIACQHSGRQGFAVRVLPGVPDMATPFEPGLIIWS